MTELGYGPERETAMWQRRHPNFDDGQWTDCTREDAKKFGPGGAYEGWEIREISERTGTTTTITDEQAETIAAEVYARTPVDSTETAFQLDWELVRAGIAFADQQWLSAIGWGGTEGPKQPFQWQKRHYNIHDGEWRNTTEADAKWWAANAMGWEIRALCLVPLQKGTGHE